MARREYVRRLNYKTVQLAASSLPPYDTSFNSTYPINATDINNTSSDNDDSSGIDTGLHQIVSPITAIASLVIVVAMYICTKSVRTPEAERRIRRYKRGGYKKKPPNYYRLKCLRKSLNVQQVVHVDETGKVQLRDVCELKHKSKDDDNDDVSEDTLKTSSEVEDVGESTSSSPVVSEDSKCENQVASCYICLEPYKEGDIVARNNNPADDCMHVFHQHCIYQWLKNPKHNDC
jgi:hypothetical protein